MAFRSPTDPLNLLDQSYRNTGETMTAPQPTFHGGPTPSPAPSPITSGRGGFDINGITNRNTPPPGGVSMPGPTPTFHGGPATPTSPNRFGTFSDFLGMFGNGRTNNYVPFNAPQGPNVPYRAPNTSTPTPTPTPLPTVPNPNTNYNPPPSGNPAGTPTFTPPGTFSEKSIQYKGGMGSGTTYNTGGSVNSKAPPNSNTKNPAQNDGTANNYGYSTGPTTYNHLNYNSPSARYQAWVAAGKPIKDVNGYDLDNQGNYVNAMFDQQYVKQNASQLGQAYVDRFYANNPGFKTPEGAGVNSIDPWGNFETQNNGVFAGGSAANPNTSINNIPLGQGGALVEMLRRLFNRRGGSFNMPTGGSPGGYTPNGNTPNGYVPYHPGENMPMDARVITDSNGREITVGRDDPRFYSQPGGSKSLATSNAPTSNSYAINPITGQVASSTADGIFKSGATSTGSASAAPTGNNTPPPSGNGNASNPSGSGSVTVDPNTGHLVHNGQPVNSGSLYGTAGPLQFQPFSASQAQTWGYQYNPQYYESYQVQEGEGGYETYYRLKPEIAARLNGMIQLGQTGVGGPGEVIDASQVVYDPEFGYLTKPENIREPQGSRFTEFMNNGGLIGALALPFAWEIALQSGMFGGGAGAGAGSGSFGATVPTITGEGALPFLTQPTMEALTGTVAVGGGSSLVSSLGSGAATLIKPIINAITGGGGSGGGGNFDLTRLLGSLVGTGQTNSNLGQYQTLVNQMLEYGMPFANYRQEGIQRLLDLQRNPGQIDSNPLFRAQVDKSQKDLARTYSSRGLNISGAEMSGLTEDYQSRFENFYQREFDRLARQAGVDFNPSSVAAAGITAGGNMLANRQSRDFTNVSDIIRALTQGGGGGNGGGGNLIQDILDRIFGMDFTPGLDIPDIPIPDINIEDFGGWQWNDVQDILDAINY